MNKKDLKQSALDDLRDSYLHAEPLSDMEAHWDAMSELVDASVDNSLAIEDEADRIIEAVEIMLDFLVRRKASNSSVINASALIIHARKIKELSVLIYNRPNRTCEAGC